LPSFIRQLADPTIKTVFVSGCGRGFDFVHSMMLYPELKRMGKKVIIGSYSFGDPKKIGNAPVYFSEDETLVKKVSGKSIPDQHYAPEVQIC